MKEYLALFAVTFLAVGAFGGSHIGPDMVETPTIEVKEEVSPHQMTANVMVERNGQVVAEDHNVMVDGQEIITNLLTSNDDSQYNVIAVGEQDYEPADTDTRLQGRLDGSSPGFGPQTADLNISADEESFQYQTTFVATGDQDVVTTALEIQHDRYNSTGYENLDTFAATNFGRTIPLEEDDELTVTWEIIPQNPSSN